MANDNFEGGFWLRWACVSASASVHSETPTVAQCEADGWRQVGRDPRYENSVLMRKDRTE